MAHYGLKRATIWSEDGRTMEPRWQNIAPTCPSLHKMASGCKNVLSNPTRFASKTPNIVLAWPQSGVKMLPTWSQVGPIFFRWSRAAPNHSKKQVVKTYCSTYYFLDINTPHPRSTPPERVGDWVDWEGWVAGICGWWVWVAGGWQVRTGFSETNAVNRNLPSTSKLTTGQQYELVASPMLHEPF
jgi:hypothetical protein